ncbi:glycosyltransferase [Nocardioides halotolerans]|uniref:glycosyltransferase n=1 Tax=Nocardioides halotolerans TaxID=433660 RepID=UPI00041F7527|nr:glycosyltransferase [Nocardioides halotolerans]
MTEVAPPEVRDDVLPLDRLADLLEPERADRLRTYAETARRLLADREVWNVSATSSGDGVAELLSGLLGYGHIGGLETHWLVLETDPAFARITKRMHNFLHGAVGDAGRLDEPERRHYETVLADNLERISGRVRLGDVVVLHDPPTAGLVPGLRELGAHVIWRSHMGADAGTRATETAWAFLRPYVEAADAVILSRAGWAPRWLNPSRAFVIAPSIDPFAPKNAELSREQVEATLRAAGIVAGNVGERFRDFTRGDGTEGRVRRHSGVILTGEMLPAGERYVLQASRWDRLKDMGGVLSGFADAIALMPSDVHLVLAGPRPEEGSDPEGAQVARECLAAWQELPAPTRRRVHLCSLPADDPDEHAHLVNALQRQAGLVVQKSLAEGFGLTVTESMWKARAVLASPVGGIQDQVVDGRNGMLLDDPWDLESFGSAIAILMRDDRLRGSLGAAARETVRDRYLGDRHLVQYVDLFAALLD